MIAATATKAGSGSFFSFQSSPTATSAISAVIQSLIARSARTITAPVIAPMAAAVFLEVGCGQDSEEIARQESAQGGYHGSRKTSDQVTDETDRDDHRAGRDHGDGHGIHELSLVQPLMVVDHAAIEKGNNGETAAENKCAGLREEGANLRKQAPIETAGKHRRWRSLRAERRERRLA